MREILNCTRCGMTIAKGLCALCASAGSARNPNRLLPQSADAEKGVLSSTLIAPREVCGLCVEKQITPEHFYVPAHERIYREIYDAWARNEPLDFIMLTQLLRDKGTLEACGGAAFITDLFCFLPTAANAAYYVDILIEKQILRNIVSVCTEGAGRGYDEQEDPMGLLDEVEQQVMGIRGKRRVDRQTIKQTVIEVIGDMQTMMDNPGRITGLPTGFRLLDEKSDGMIPTEMIVIAARPSIGKTSLGMNIVEYLALEIHIPCLIFSLEMGRKPLVTRLVCSRARVNYMRLRDGLVSERDMNAIQTQSARISTAPIYIEDESSLTIQEIRAIGRRYKLEHDIKFVMIDYLQLARSSTKRAQENRTQEVSEISGGCKAMAKELNVPVVVLAQLKRPDNPRHRPRLESLKESSSCEQDADKVWFIERPEMNTDDEDEKEALKGQAIINVAKHRNGETGDVPMTFLKEFSRFEERAYGI